MENDLISIGDSAKAIPPPGYCRNPANIDIDRIAAIEDEVADKYSAAIIEICRM